MKQERTHNLTDQGLERRASRTPEALQSKEKERKPFKFLLVNTNHLDYAWYRPREESKIREAELIDGVLDALQASEISGFTIEQSVAGREYMRDLRPERSEEYEQMCRDGKFELIGTEIQQEVYLAGEEVFFWNVEVGHDEVERQGGRPSKALYIPDTFGFPDGFPKAASAAGYNNLIFTRGMGEQAALLGAVFNWESDDGSSILAVPMPDGYGSASNLGRWTFADGVHNELEDQPDKWTDAAIFMLNKTLNRFGDRFTKIGLEHVLLGAGSDFQPVDTDLPNIIADVQEKMQTEFPGVAFSFGTFEDYVERVDESIDRNDLNTYRGELRSAADHPVLRGIDSARVPLKQEAEKTERQVLNADAMLALSILRAKIDPTLAYAHDKDLLRTAMYRAKTVALPAYSHDAISGCGTDDVPQDMLNRLRDARGLADQTLRNSLFNLSGGKDDYHVKMRLEPDISVTNTQPHARRDIVSVPLEQIKLHADHLTAETDNGEIPVQIVEKDRKKYAMVAVDVPGYSSASVRFKEAEAPMDNEQKEKEQKNTIENEFYKVQVLANGVVEVHDKATGVVSHGHMFEDQADTGDEYNFNPLDGAKPITTEKSKAKVTVLTEGPVLSELQIDMDMLLPAELTKDRKARSDETVPTPISTVVRLTQGVDRVDFTTTLTNNAKDHRLRVLFKTPNGDDKVRAKEMYGITDRTGVPIPGGESWLEPLPISTSHYQGMVAAGDVALFSKGLQEYEAFEKSDGKIDEIALTLIRGVGWLSRDDLKVRKVGAGPIEDLVTSQCPDEHTFEYSMTMRGQEDNASLIRRMNDSRFGLQIGPKGVSLDDVLKIEGEGFVVSALKPLRDGSGAMLRLYNPNTTASTYSFSGAFSQVTEVDAVFGKPKPDAGEDASTRTLRKGEIITLALQ